MGTIRILAPLQEAWGRMRLELFSAFRLGDWLILAFTAWIAHLGDFGYNLNFQGRMKLPGAGKSGQFPSGVDVERLTEYAVAHLILIALALAVFGCLTCCIGSILLAIPYLGMVILLPLPVWLRYYSVSFLNQFDADFAFYDQPPPAPPA